MSAVANVPAWMPGIPAAQSTPLNEAFTSDSLKVAEQTAYVPPVMSYEELWAMIERNMGHPLIPVNLGDK